MFDGIRTRKRLEELEDRVRDLEQSNRALELEWETMYDKFRRVLATISKRAQREEEREAAAPKTADSVTAVTGSSDRTADLNEMILKQRRARAVPQGNARSG